MAAHFIKAWRKYRGLTLKELAARVGERTSGLFTHASLSRIERGTLPYSQPVLEGVGTVHRIKREMTPNL
jgi:transcriptional regulator with XRE-family HTH domain